MRAMQKMVAKPMKSLFNMRSYEYLTAPHPSGGFAILKIPRAERGIIPIRHSVIRNSNASALRFP